MQFIGTWKGKFYLGDDMIDAEFNKFKEKLKEQKYLKEENEKLKIENEQLAHFNSPKIAALEKENILLANTILRISDENAQLKVQLQNCDKASQVERKPHKCPVCRGIIGICKIYEQVSDEVKSLGIAKQDEQGIWYIPCIPCNGTGIVWEPK